VQYAGQAEVLHIGEATGHLVWNINAAPLADHRVSLKSFGVALALWLEREVLPH
jgi:hypothetical protein